MATVVIVVVALGNPAAITMAVIAVVVATKRDPAEENQKASRDRNSGDRCS